jgi:hypothetical protein
VIGNAGRPPVRPVAWYERLLLLALAAPLCASLAFRLGAWSTRSQGRALGAAVLVLGLGAVVWRALAPGRGRWRRFAAPAAEVAAAALLAGLVVRHRATGYFTAQALREALVPLVALHVAGMALGSAVRERGGWAAGVADTLVRAALFLTGAFWLFTAADMLYAAGVAIVLVGVALALALVMRAVERAARVPFLTDRAASSAPDRPVR